MNEKTHESSDSKLLFRGIFFSNLFALLAFAVAYGITNWNEEAGGILSFSEFVLVPVAMGIIAMKFWLPTERRLASLFPYALLNTLIAIGISGVFMGEGYICILIVSPLVLAFNWIGVVIGKYILKKNRTTLQASTLLLLIVLFVLDTFSEHNYVNVVSDEIIIDAPVERVWPYVAQHPVNTSKPRYWLFQIGLPAPIQSTVTADTVGSVRKCIFSNGATFDEVVVESQTNRVYTFDVTKQPEDPEIIGHIEIRRGQFILIPTSDGSTRLIGKSWYRLTVYPSWYYDIWAEDITREVHLRVMEHIKQLSENDI